MYCTTCGRKIADGRSSCRYCGTRLAVSVGVLAACLILLIGGGFLAYRVMGRPSQAVTSALEQRPAAALSWLAAGAVDLPATGVPTTITTAPPTTTTVTAPVATLFPQGAEAYAGAVTTLLGALTEYRDRFVGLTDLITATSPRVPRSVFDELKQMTAALRAGRTELGRAEIPAGYEELTKWLDRAARYMRQRADYTLSGLQAMERTGRKTSAKTAFAKASQAGDRFESAFAEFRRLADTR